MSSATSRTGADPRSPPSIGHDSTHLAPYSCAAVRVREKLHRKLTESNIRGVSGRKRIKLNLVRARRAILAWNGNPARMARVGGWMIALSLAAVQGLFGQNARPAQAAGTLDLHHAVERELGPGQTDEYELDTNAGQFVRLVVWQKGVDVIITIVDPSGKKVLEADRPSGEFSPEAASFISRKSGNYRVQVQGWSESAAKGRYTIEWLESRKPTARDRRD